MCFFKFISLMLELQGINQIVDPIALILWDMQIPQVFYYTGNNTNHIISTDHIMCSLINITPVCPLIKITHWGPYNFNGIQKKNPLWDYRQLGLITFKIDLSKTPFTESTIVQYQLGITTQGNKISLSLIDNDYFNIPYIVYMVPKYPAGYKLPYQANNKIQIM